MRRGLCAIHQRHHAVLTRDGNHLAHRVDRTQRIRHVGEARDFGACIEQLFVRRQIEFAVIKNRRHANLRALFIGHHLPRHDIRMMLQRGQNNFIARVQKLAAPAVRHQIDALGSAAGENHLAFFFGVDEGLQLAACGFVFGGGGFGQIMHRTMDVGVLRGLITHPTIHHLLGHLARCRIIQENQGLIVDLEVKYGEIRTDARNVERRHF